MRVLDDWKHLLSTPKTLLFPKLRLIANDNEPPIVEGSGEVRFPNLQHIYFTLTGCPSDFGFAVSKIKFLDENPYDPLARFRLIGTDDAGTEWNLGWTIPTTDVANVAWTFTGELESLLPHHCEHHGLANTELAFVIPPRDVSHFVLAHYVSSDQGLLTFRREHEIVVLGARINFLYNVDTRVLLIKITHSDLIPPTYGENWVCEPLRILLGQHFAPRLIARNTGKHTHVFCRTQSKHVENAGWARLWNESSGDKRAFWSLYADLLTFVALARDHDGSRNFEPHALTQLYMQIISAASGSRWVWALTFASAIEAIAKIVCPPGGPKPAHDKEAAAKLIGHIEKWDGAPGLKQNAINAVTRSAFTTSADSFRELKTQNVINNHQLKAWKDIRHSVMHGNLVSPYSTEEADKKLLLLATMMHDLTKETVRRANSASS